MNLTTCPPYDQYAVRAQEFRSAYELTPGLSTTSLRLQQTLIDEEYKELVEACDQLGVNITNKRSRENVLKELCDLVYVCHQMASAFGWDLGEAFRRVHTSNMSKLDHNGKPIRREDGKVLKSSQYIPPTLIDLV